MSSCDTTECVAVKAKILRRISIRDDDFRAVQRRAACNHVFRTLMRCWHHRRPRFINDSRHLASKSVQYLMPLALSKVIYGLWIRQCQRRLHSKQRRHQNAAPSANKPRYVCGRYLESLGRQKSASAMQFRRD